ncbi:hypothetical protein PEC302110_14980 [Pectobacterium araliae]|uniref:Uncharacterized protein n=1 Tax=Pectobacterium araliae TaxID=3073862 RepID=A0AAN0KE63_9GAMM|nr:hypothetical protein PEC302110_14980 [Pectobacterium sp. MAFF 302110]
MVLSIDDYEKFWQGAILKKFSFVNDAAEREYKAPPADVQDEIIGVKSLFLSNTGCSCLGRLGKRLISSGVGL